MLLSLLLPLLLVDFDCCGDGDNFAVGGASPSWLSSSLNSLNCVSWMLLVRLFFVASLFARHDVILNSRMRESTSNSNDIEITKIEKEIIKSSNNNDGKSKNNK